jgi:hypothetical protein
MKTSNLAWRVEPFEMHRETEPSRQVAPAPAPDAPKRIRPRPSFHRRTIEIRDQGFGLFRVR